MLRDQTYRVVGAPAACQGRLSIKIVLVVTTIFSPIIAYTQPIRHELDSSASTTRYPSLTTQTVELDRLVVTRSKNNVNYPDAPPFETTITDQPTVQQLYNDIHSLSPFEKGRHHCPMDTGIMYALDFYRQTTRVLHADYAPTGCERASLNGGTFESVTGDQLRTNLRRALALSVQEFDQRK